MTWTYALTDDGGSMDVFDHTDTLVATIQNDGSGFKSTEEVYSVMRAEAEKARDNENMERWRDIHIRLAADDVAPKE